MTNLIERSKSLSDFISSWLGIVAVIAAGLFSAVQYLEHKQSVKLERTLTYVQRYNDGDYVNSTQQLEAAVHSHYSELTAILLNTDYSPEQLEQQYSQFILKVLEKDQLYLQLSKVFSFHVELIQCINAGLCTEDVSRTFFSNNARDLIRTFYPFICSKRAQWKDQQAYASILDFYNGNNNQELCKQQ